MYLVQVLEATFIRHSNKDYEETRTSDFTNSHMPFSLAILAKTQMRIRHKITI